MDKDILLFRLNTIAFPDMDRMLGQIVNLRIRDELSDMLLVFAYEPCLSVGSKSFNDNDILKPLDFFTSQGIFLYKAVRGGGLTYYWPGQLLFYPIIKLEAGERNIPAYMHNLEEVALRTLSDLGVTAHRKRDETAQIGLWVDGAKVASTGIRISRWVTSYGMALNLAGDHSPSDFIRPCGLDVKLQTVEELTGKATAPENVIQQYGKHFQDVFGRRVHAGSLNDVLRPILGPFLEQQSIMEFK